MKHSFSLRMSADERAAVEQVHQRVPAVSRALVVRAALRRGLRELAQDPRLVLVVEEPQGGGK